MQKNTGKEKQAKLKTKLFKDLIIEYYSLSKALNDLQAQHDTLKAKFYSSAGEVFDRLDKDKKVIKVRLDKTSKNDELHQNLVDDDLKGFTVTKVQRIKLQYDIQGLKENLDKEVVEKVIKKDYKLINVKGFLKYLKTIGADPNEVTKYIRSVERVDEKALNQLESVGDLQASDLEGFVHAITSNPYYLLKGISDNKLDERNE